MAQCIDQGVAQGIDRAARVSRRTATARWIGSVGNALLAASDELARYGRRIRERRALDRLDDAMLRDIGISRADVELEVSKPFWQG